MRFPLDIGGLSKDGQVTTELGTGPLRYAVASSPPRISDLLLTWSKVSGCNGSKSLNAGRERNPRKCVRLLGELSNLSVDVAAVQEIPFTCVMECWVLEDDYVILSAYSSRSSVGVSWLIGRSLNADVNLVLEDNSDRLVVADIAVKSFEFRVVVVYAPNIVSERVSFFRRLAPFLDDPKQIVLMGDWNVFFDLKKDRVGRGARGSGRCESSLINFMARHDLGRQVLFGSPKGRDVYVAR